MTRPSSSASSSPLPSLADGRIGKQSNGSSAGGSSASVAEAVSVPTSSLKSSNGGSGGGGGGGSTDKGAMKSSTDSNFSTRPYKDMPRYNVDARILDARRQLPIYIGRDAIADAVRENETIVLLGETGSGKTTQIPQYLYEAGLADGLEASKSSTSATAAGKRKQRQPQMIGITQPRRVAAISLAKRVAVELGCPEPGADDAADVGTSGNGAAASSNDDHKRVVGYSVRFDDRTTADTRIKFMTDGLLLSELLSSRSAAERKKRRANASSQTAETSAGIVNGSPDKVTASSPGLLDRYSVIIIDEAHERSVHTDVVLGLVKQVQRERRRRRMAWLKRRKAGELVGDDDQEEPTELKVVVMSATIDADKFAQFFATPRGTAAPILYVKGRQHPIKLYHSDAPCLDWTESCKKLLVLLSSQPPGDVLIFMTGAEEIESCAADIKDLSEAMQAMAVSEGKQPPMKFLVVKLYAALGGEAIRQCFAPTPPNTRKIVLATNIAETSITISGIKYVIDCGLAKEKTFRNSIADEQQGSNGASASGHAGIGSPMEMLMVKPISKAAARQRAGRAGRETDGFCYRLYTKEVFDKLEDSTQPEIMRTDLSSVVLDVFAMGLDPMNFDWLDRPDDDDIKRAVMNLVELGALEGNPQGGSQADVPDKNAVATYKLTELGRQMSKLPLLPALSKILLTARSYSGGDEEPHQVFSQALDLVSILSTERRTILYEPPGRGGVGEEGDDAASKRRQEADRARERLAHRSGDHGTQLQALYAFEEAEENSKYRDIKAGQKTKVLDHKRLKEWCDTNYVSLKAVREALRIRAQILQVCRRNRWLPDGVIDAKNRKLQVLDTPEDDGSNSSASEDEADTDLVVTRGSINAAFGMRNAAASQGTSTFNALRRCLVQSKRSNVAVRDGQTTYYRSLHADATRFRIHPSSSLLFSIGDDTVAPNSRLPQLIIFEDIIFTSQLFARTVSTVEATWLAELTSNRSS